MEPDTAPTPDSGAAQTGRPRNVDLALGAILLRCVLALAAAFALFGAKDELRRNAATLHPEWSAATLAEKVDSELRSNLVLTVVYIGLVLLIAKYIRDGRNWGRWLYAFVAFLVAGDVLRVAGFFSGDNILFRLLSGFTGLASLAAIVLLFLPSSAGYFRPAGASASPLGALFGGRAALGASREAAGRGTTGARGAGAREAGAREAAGRGTVSARGAAARGAATRPEGRATDPVSLTKQAAERPTAAAPASSKRPAPRAKSRKQTPQ